jgi:hypothetical protein
MRISAESPFRRRLLRLGTETRYPTLLLTLFFGEDLRMLRLRSSEHAAKCNLIGISIQRSSPCAYFGYCH